MRLFVVMIYHRRHRKIGKFRISVFAIQLSNSPFRVSEHYGLIGLLREFNTWRIRSSIGVWHPLPFSANSYCLLSMMKAVLHR